MVAILLEVLPLLLEILGGSDFDQRPSKMTTLVKVTFLLLKYSSFVSSADTPQVISRMQFSRESVVCVSTNLVFINKRNA